MDKAKWVYCTCPVCNGSGIVSFGFYTQTSGQWTSSGGTEGCRSCGGTGIVWVRNAKVKETMSVNEYIREEWGGVI